MNDYDCYWNLDSCSSDPSDVFSLTDDDTFFPFFSNDPSHFCPILFGQEDEPLPPLFLPSRLDDSWMCETESMSSVPHDNSASCSDCPSTITLEAVYPSDNENASSSSDSCIPRHEEKRSAKSSSSVRRLLQPKKSILPQEKKKTRKPNVPRHIRDHIGYLAMEFRAQNHGISMKSIAKKVDRRLKIDFPEWYGKINVLQLIYNKKQNKWDKFLPKKCLVCYETLTR